MNNSTTTTSTSPTDNLRAWILCAPACVAMVVLNIAPAGRALVEGPPRPLAAEITTWAISLLVVGSHTLAVCGAILAIEVPIAFGLAILLMQRAGDVATTNNRLLAAILGGLAWRLLFGGTIGFGPPTDTAWSTVVVEVWRTLPLAVLLLYLPLRRDGRELAEVAQLDGASVADTVRRVYLPMCKSAILMLAAFRIVDYLRSANVPMISPAAANRVTWTLLVLTVALLAMQVADGRRKSA